VRKSQNALIKAAAPSPAVIQGKQMGLRSFFISITSMGNDSRFDRSQTGWTGWCGHNRTLHQVIRQCDKQKFAVSVFYKIYYINFLC
jgi:hypothetical protein